MATESSKSSALNLPLEWPRCDPDAPRAPRRSFRAIVAIGIIALTVVSVLGARSSREWPPWRSTDLETQDVATVSEARVAIFALGRLEPHGEAVAVGAPFGAAGARIQELLVSESDEVVRGSILAVLDSEPQLLADREAAFRKVEQARALFHQAEIAVASTRAELTARQRTAKTRQEMARLRLERRIKLVGNHYASKEELDHARQEFEAAEQEEAIVAAQLERYLVPAGADPVDVQVSRENLAVAEAELKRTEARLEQAYVRAPFDGTVLRMESRPGEGLGEGPLLWLGDTAVMMARVEVYESDVRHVKVGQQVRLTSPALDQPLDGLVERVGSFVRKQEIVEADPAAHTDARVIEVMIRVASNSTARARRFVGLQVRAEILP